MFQTAQCVNSPLGASGSSTIKTRLFASEGTSEICKGGLVFGPSHENFDGMFPPCWKAELVIFILAPPAAPSIAIAVMPRIAALVIVALFMFSLAAT
jgi:hypothetical protein